MTNTTLMDVKKLSQEPSAQVRGLLATKIASDFRASNFSAKEQEIATEIFRLLTRDAEIKIRQALARELAHCPGAPRDVILKLAADEAAVATAVLEHSSVLTEDDLIAIVRSTQEVLKLCAIARRDTLSQDLSTSLLESSNTIVLQNLFRNKGAVLNEKNLMPQWPNISFSATLLETLVERGGLSLSVVDKLYSAVSDELKYKLSGMYRMHTPAIHKAASDAREWELLGITPVDSRMGASEDELVEDLVEDLYLGGRLTHSLLMRALCVGNLSVFETGIARLAGVPRVNARILLTESSGLGLDAIYHAAHMPEGFYEAVKVLLRISLEETEFGRIKRNDFRKRVIDRIYMGKYNRTVENMEYLLSIIGGRIIAAADVH